MARLRLIVVAPLLVAGCEVFFGIKESSSSGAGASGTGGTGTTTAPEAGADAPADHDAGSFCAAYQDAFLCADFDDGSITAHWTDPNQSGKDLESALDTVVYVSAPASLAVTSVSADASPSCEASRVVAQFPGTASGIHVDFDFSGCDGVLTKAGSSLDFLNINCTIDSTTQFGIVNWGLFPGGYQINVYGANAAMDGGTLTQTFTPGTPSASGFTHVRVDVVFGTAGKAQLSLDGGAPVGASGLNTSCPTTHAKALAMGMFGCEQLVACEVRFDNVVVVVDP